MGRRSVIKSFDFCHLFFAFQVSPSTELKRFCSAFLGLKTRNQQSQMSTCQKCSHTFLRLKDDRDCAKCKARVPGLSKSEMASLNVRNNFYLTPEPFWINMVAT
jgi:hypothetical protein